MNSAHVDEQLLALVERRLSRDDRARVEAHLAGCARCRLAARELDDTVSGLQKLPAALRGLPLSAARQWPAVWVRVRAAGPARRLWPQMSVYLGVVTGFLAFVSVIPGAYHAAPASVTAGLAAGPQHTQPATVAFHTEYARADSVTAAEPTQAGTEPIHPIPVPTPVPGP